MATKAKAKRPLSANNKSSLTKCRQALQKQYSKQEIVRIEGVLQQFADLLVENYLKNRDNKMPEKTRKPKQNISKCKQKQVKASKK